MKSLKMFSIVFGLAFFAHSAFALDVITFDAESCASYAAAAPMERDGYSVTDPTFYSLYAPTESLRTYYFSLYIGMDKKTAAVTTDENCKILDIKYLDQK
ncbi:MAG: hypothetical protein Q7U04_06900 [Bacteriovorax sp.]|nr:hypothetical protein [Bacteriovorax sp.]